MTEEEFKKEAKRLGYRVFKVKPREKFIPCTCGANMRERWSMWDAESNCFIITLKCRRCGKSASGKGEEEAKSNWNEMIKKELQLQGKEQEHE